MSPSSPVRTRQTRRAQPPQAGSNRPSRAEAVGTIVRSILLGVAAVSVIATSNYFAYLIGRKQVTYEELRRQVDRVVKLVDEKRLEEELAVSTLKQRQERLEQNASAFSGLTTSTINGKTTVVSAPAPANEPISEPSVDSGAAAPPKPEATIERSEPPPSVTPKPSQTRGAVRHRAAKRKKVAPPKPSPGEAFAEQPGQFKNTTAAVAAPDAGAGTQ